MTSIRTFFAFVALAGLAACAGPSVVLPPVAPEDVEIYERGEEPSEPFAEIAHVRQQETMDTPTVEVIAKAREKAARLGADALLIKEWRLIRNATNPTVTLIGVAIYFPDRHPEIDPESGAPRRSPESPGPRR